jgi:hypothetical protein
MASASMPLCPGMDRSITSTSISVVRTRSMASRPLAASPTTRRSTCSEKNCLSPVRTMAWSSTIPTLIMTALFLAWPAESALPQILFTATVAAGRPPMRLFSWLKNFSIAQDGHRPAAGAAVGVRLVVINETGYERSSAALDDIAVASQTRSNTLNKLLQHMLDAETGQRGYLLTGDPRYLEPYDLLGLRYRPDHATSLRRPVHQRRPRK